MTKIVFLLNTEHIGNLGRGHMTLASFYQVPTLKLCRLKGRIWACSEKKHFNPEDALSPVGDAGETLSTAQAILAS